MLYLSSLADEIYSVTPRLGAISLNPDGLHEFAEDPYKVGVGELYLGDRGGGGEGNYEYIQEGGVGTDYQNPGLSILDSVQHHHLVTNIKL